MLPLRLVNTHHLVAQEKASNKQNKDEVRVKFSVARWTTIPGWNEWNSLFP